MKRILASLAIAGAATVAGAHQGVENPAVQARMTSMKAMGDAVTEVGQMFARGQDAFDAQAVSAAIARIEREVEQTPQLFKAPEVDPKTEALPAIWDNWDDFLDRNAALQDRLAAPAPQTSAALGPWLTEIGAACSACHKIYRR